MQGASPCHDVLQLAQGHPTQAQGVGLAPRQARPGCPRPPRGAALGLALVPQALLVSGRQAQVAAVHLMQVDAVAALPVVHDGAQLLRAHLRRAQQACITTARPQLAAALCKACHKRGRPDSGWPRHNRER